MSLTFNPAVRRSLKSGVLRDKFPLGELRQTKLGEICPTARERFPFYFQLPYDDPIALLKWRIYVRKRCARDLAFRAKIWEMCRLDVAFFCVTFLVIFEPRPFPRWLPFSLWSDQVSLLSWFVEIFGRRSGGVNKTRGIGLSWLSAAFKFHAWLFCPECKIAVITEDESKLDGQDANSCLGKQQYLFDHLPAWAKRTASGASKLVRIGKDHAFINVENGAIIQGFVSRAQKLRQLRFTMIFADEFAFYDRVDQEEWVVAAGGCTNCLLLVSTWNSFDDIFNYIMFEEKSSLLKMEAFWENNTERWRGAYKIINGEVILLDPTFNWAKEYPDGYEFGVPDVMPEGYERSPWVDAELAQPGKTKDIYKALRDIYGRRICEFTNLYYGHHVIEAAEVAVRDPVEQGLLDTSEGQVAVIPTNQSNIRIFTHERNGPFVMYCDLSHGQQADYSALVVLDRYGEQVLEYGVNNRNTTEFAADATAIARWLAGDRGDGHVLIDFEANGPLANTFYAGLDACQYGHVHMSPHKDQRKAAPGEMSTYAGTRNADKGHRNYREFERAVTAMEARIRSARVVAEMRLLGKDENGYPSFPRGQDGGHGDFLTAAAGAWWRARNRIVSQDDYNETGRQTENMLQYGYRNHAEPRRSKTHWLSRAGYA